MKTHDVIIEHLKALDKGVGVIHTAQQLAKHFNLEFYDDKWIKKVKLNKKQRDIVHKVEEFTKLPLKQMLKMDRKHEYVAARYIIVVEILRKSKVTLSKAGEIFNFNYATVLYARKQLTGEDSKLTEFYNEYLKLYENEETFNNS